jgi:hypothetical protein
MKVKEGAGISADLSASIIPLVLIIIAAVVGAILLFRRRLFPGRGDMPEDLEGDPYADVEPRPRRTRRTRPIVKEEGWDKIDDEGPGTEEMAPEDADEELPSPRSDPPELDEEEPAIDDDILGASTIEATTSEGPPPVPVKVEKPVVEDKVDKDSSIAKLEKMFEEEEEAQDKVKKKEKDDLMDLDSILSKLSEGSSKGGDKE